LTIVGDSIGKGYLSAKQIWQIWNPFFQKSLNAAAVGSLMAVDCGITLSFTVLSF
jgi:hypothetical protein